MERRTQLVANTGMILGLTHLACVLIIQLLEQGTHGVVARHVKAKAEVLGLGAQLVALEGREKRERGDRAVYSDVVKDALGNYERGLKDGRERLGERERDAKRVLWGYGVGREEGSDKEKVLKEIARVYGELKREIREVERDVGRLRGK